MPKKKLVAIRYAKGLVDVAMEKHIHEKVAAELSSFEDILSSQKELRDLFENPAFPFEARKKVLIKILEQMKTEKILENFLLLLLKRNRIKLIPDILVAYMDHIDERLGIISAEVRTAKELPTEYQELLKGRLASMTGKGIELNYSIDRSLIGGITLQVGSTIFDGSIKGQLEGMRRRITGD